MYLIVTQKKWHHSNFNKIKKKILSLLVIKKNLISKILKKLIQN